MSYLISVLFAVCSTHRAGLEDHDWQECRDFVSYYIGSEIIDGLLIIYNHAPLFVVRLQLPFTKPIFLRLTMWEVFRDLKALLYMPYKEEKTREMLHMYIKLLLERLFKDLFFGKPSVHYHDFQLCAYCLFMKHKIIVLKSTSLLSSVANTACAYIYTYLRRTANNRHSQTHLRKQQIKQTKNNHSIKS